MFVFLETHGVHKKWPVSPWTPFLLLTFHYEKIKVLRLLNETVMFLWVDPSPAPGASNIWVSERSLPLTHWWFSGRLQMSVFSHKTLQSVFSDVLQQTQRAERRFLWKMMKNCDLRTGKMETEQNKAASPSCSPHVTRTAWEFPASSLSQSHHPNEF